jgi:hypothetical protein
MRFFVAFLLLAVSMGYAQGPESSTIDITGDAAINANRRRVLCSRYTTGPQQVSCPCLAAVTVIRHTESVLSFQNGKRPNLSVRY